MALLFQILIPFSYSNFTGRCPSFFLFIVEYLFGIYRKDNSSLNNDSYQYKHSCRSWKCKTMMFVLLYHILKICIYQCSVSAFFLYEHYVYLYKDSQLDKCNYKLIFYRNGDSLEQTAASKIHYFPLEFIALASRCVIRRGTKLRGLFLKYGSFSASHYVQKSVLNKYKTN